MGQAATRTSHEDIQALEAARPLARGIMLPRVAPSLATPAGAPVTSLYESNSCHNRKASCRVPCSAAAQEVATLKGP